MIEMPIDIQGARRKVLFICKHNSTRSQMAEGFLNSLYGKGYEAFSAGTEPAILDPRAIAVMNEVGIDISKNRTKSVDEMIMKRVQFDIVATLCDCAKDDCPFFPAKEHMHHGFPDPGTFSYESRTRMGDPDAMLVDYRRLRDDIREWVDANFGGKVTAESDVQRTERKIQ